MKLKKKTIKIAFLLLILILLIYFLLPSNNTNIYQFKDNTLNYAKDRGPTNHNIELRYTNNSIDVYKLSYKSRPFIDQETTIHALLFMPNNKDRVPGIVYLPAGGATKESRSNIASTIAEFGYAVLIIDQRGIGETGGVYLNMQQDYEVLLQGNEPIQHLSVFDALKSFDVLREIDRVDKDNIAMLGISMGGQYAIISSAIDERIKGTVTISSAGFHIQRNDAPYNNYVLSIDPDHYISKISPRPIHMFHGSKDAMIPLESAQQTFNKAQDPKTFHLIEGCEHGYCDKMKDDLREALQEMFTI